ncbi:MAG: glycine-rich domain-containing protein [Patescibacteria group bacterium]
MSPNTGVAHNFTTSQTYTVTAADASTQDYTVTVTVDTPGSFIISNVASSTDTASALITWDTNQSSSSTVQYGLLAPVTIIATSTGGTITTDGTYWIHTFTTNGTFTPSEAISVDALVVGGGGSGGSDPAAYKGGGGGGGGGVVYTAAHAVTAQAYSVTVGNGGSSNGTVGGVGGHGVTSTFDGISADGGGGGGNSGNSGNQARGGTGGSGGGGGSQNGIGGSGITDQGYAGGTAQGSSAPAAGGGGAGVAGSNGGSGGNGTSNSITGTPTYYGGGGGGGSDAATSTGGLGGGAAGSRGGSNSNCPSLSGTANTGGGGGGVGKDNCTTAGSGGSGIVIIRYPIITSVVYTASSSSNALVTSHSVQLTGLTPNTTYHFNVASQNGAGTVASSTDNTFRTVVDVSPPVISSVASSTSVTTATITWTTNENATSSVEYGTTTGYGNTSSSVLSVASHVITLTDLISNTLYHFRVGSQDASGNATTTMDYTFRTPDETAPTVTAFVIPSTSNSLTVPITTFTATDAGGGVTGYLLTESATTPASDNAGWTASAPTEYVFTTEGSNTLYAWAKDAAGNVSVSLNDSVAIDTSGPLLISNVASSTEFTSAQISWDTNQSSSSTVRYGLLASATAATSTGGIITSDGTNWIHTFTTNGTFTPNGLMNVDALVVGGGGSGGSDAGTKGGGGGGGGGGVIYTQSYSVNVQSYSVTVGNGGVANTTNNSVGGHGATSTFDLISADGGGGGGNTSLGSGANGGSGGGGAGNHSYGNLGGSGRTGQGNAGASDTLLNNIGGGGGGAGVVATDQNGGNGVANTITGISTYYGGGGGGAGDSVVGSGGLGGGGSGSTGLLGGSGTANTGGGGGGAGQDGGSATGGVGGSGVVIIRYPIATTVLYGVASSSNVLTESHAIQLTGLTPNTTYHFNVASQNGAGTVASSTDYTFQTVADVTPPIISSVASTTYDTSAVITWTTNEASTSTVEYGLTTSYSSSSLDGTFIESHSISLWDLVPGTLYHFRVSSWDISGNRATSEDYTFQTPAAGTVNMRFLPEDRRTVWDPGLNSVGGIPNYTDIYATLSPSGDSDTTAIQNALTAAGAAASAVAPKVVYLNAGTYKITGSSSLRVPSYVVLRGAGPDATKLVRDFKGTGTDVKVKIVDGGLGGSENGGNVATFVYSVDGGTTWTDPPVLITNYTGWSVTNPPVLGMVITFLAGEGATYTAGDIFTIHWNDSQGLFGDWEITHTETGVNGLNLRSYGESGGIVSIGSYSWNDFGTPIDLTENAVKGAYSVTVSDTAGLAAGDLIHLDEINENVAGRVWYTEMTTSFSRWDRNVTQRLEIDHIIGNTIYFTTPFHTDFRVIQSAQILKVNHPVRYAGIEDIYAYGTNSGDGSGNFYITNGMYCWIKHVESQRSIGAGAGLGGSFRSVIRDSYIHEAGKIMPSSAEYLVDIATGSSDNLVENNIIWNGGKALTGRSSGGGNVYGYNYMDDIFISYNTSFIESGIDITHQSTPHFELSEGNQSFNFDSDTTHGNAFNIVALRNNLTGLRRSSIRPLPSYGAVTSVDNHDGHGPQIFSMGDNGPRSAVRANAYNYTFSFIGNVLGFAGMPLSIPDTDTQQTTALYDKEGSDVLDSSVLGMWMLGSWWTQGDWTSDSDPNVINSTLRDGNFDYVTNEQRWHGIGRGDTPYSAPEHYVIPNSFYLTSKPSFFGANVWPWVTPEGDTKVNTLPARARFDAGTPNSL